MPPPLKTFVIYAREDKNLRDEFLKHIKVLEDDALIRVWTDLEIPPGKEWNAQIRQQLEQTELFLAFVSVDFYNSTYIQQTELPFANERRQAGQAHIIPVLLEDCPWERYRIIKDLQVLPTGGTPVNDLEHWKTRNKAWRIVVDKLAEHAENAHAQKETQTRHEQGARSRSDRQGLKDEAAWKAATELNTLEAYENYLDDGHTLHQTEARQQVHDLTADELKRKAEQKWSEKREREAKEAAAARAEAERLQQVREAAEEKKQATAARKKQEQEETERKKRADEARRTDPFYDLMVDIKGGSFDMGSNDDIHQKPIHTVRVPDFALCKYPVTQAQWKKIMGDNPSHFKGDELPVENVSWDDAQTFLQKLNATLLAGQKPYRLPSEAEWEYAARGGAQSKGYLYAGSNDLKKVGWYWENSGDQLLSGVWVESRLIANNCRTHPVGQKAPNELGLYDLSGNVWEWCQDVWHEHYEGAPEDGSAWFQGGDKDLAVLRGGSWDLNDNFCRSANRFRTYRDIWDDDIGFRLARAASEGGE